MGEIVQKKLQKIALDFHQLVENKIFTEEEVRVMIIQIRNNEQKLAGWSKQKIDFRTCIETDKKYLSELKKRVKTRKFKGTKHLDTIFYKRLADTYKTGLKYFQDDYNFNMEYIDTLQKFPKSFTHLVRAQLNNMIRRFSHEPQVFRKAASWYFHNKDVSEAKKILLLGQTRHPKTFELYLDLIEFEIYQAEEIDAPGLTKRLETYVSEIINNKIPSVNFLGALTLILEKKGLQKVLDYMLEELLSKYSDDEDMWAFIATRELEGKFHPSSDSDSPDAISCIGKCVKRFQEGISKVPLLRRPVLWKKYLDTLVQVINENNDPQMIFFFENGIKEALKANVKLEEAHYITWLDHLPGKETPVKSLAEAFKKDTSIKDGLKQSVPLWTRYFKHHTLNGNSASINRAFKEAVWALGSNSVDVWLLHLDYHMKKGSDDEVERLYQEATRETQLTEIAMYFKPRYFFWTLETKGEKAARAIYFKLAEQRPFSRDLHAQMLVATFKGKVTSEKHTKDELLPKIEKLWSKQFGKEDFDDYLGNIDSSVKVN